MGTWGLGPFDDDTACDWGYELDAAALDERPAVLREALSAACATDYLDYAKGVKAVAAAAIVAAHQPGGPALDPVYSPDCLRDEGPIEIPSDLPDLALRAMDRVLGDDSHWRELWEEAGRFQEVIALLAPVRAALVNSQAAGPVHPAEEPAGEQLELF